MAGSIGKLALVLSATPSQLLMDLNAAKLHIAAFGKQVPGLLGRGAVGAAGSALGALGGGLLGIGDFVGSLLSPSSIIGKIGELAGIAKVADDVGLSTSALTGFQYAAKVSGVEADSLNAALKKLQKGLGGADFAADEANAGLAKFGVDTKALANESVEQQVYILAERFKDLGNPADRAAFAVAAFGKRGQDLQSFLSRGADGIRELTREAKELGLVLSGTQAAEVLKAQESIVKLESALEGVKRQLAIDLAPLVTKISTAFVQWLKDSGGVEVIVQRVVNAFLDLGLTIVGIVEDVKKLVDEVKNISLGGIARGIIPGAALVQGDGNWFRDIIPHLARSANGGDGQSGFDKARKSIEDIRKEIARLHVEGDKPLGGILQWASNVADRMRRAQDACNALTKDLTKQAAIYGMSADEIKIWELEQAGATEQQLKGAKAAKELLESLRDYDEQLDEVGRLQKETQLPAEQFAESLKRLKEMFASGALDAQTYGRALLKATTGILDAGGIALGLPKGLQQGSSEAISAINQAEQASLKGTQNPYKVLEDLLRIQTDIQRQQLALIQKQAAEVGVPLPPLIPPR